MRDIVDSLYAGSQHHELYIGVLETVEGLVRSYTECTWKRKLNRDDTLERKCCRRRTTQG
ncbi:hypothetical protein A3709_05920 [Halioglobus sp. HI00S01]|uniref:hypothetical protein n=1 Tax=Halioglobus sp. HI00S01 TaxID=1822214 RepID=UPI0007C3B615|nr:hypothetical protein [Halioglobus sp. HI00S01]KZX55928.1 hypothetical protein A3709_05920 [Halioglobus sp. HI00S01]